MLEIIDNWELSVTLSHKFGWPDAGMSLQAGFGVPVPECKKFYVFWAVGSPYRADRMPTCRPWHGASFFGRPCPKILYCNRIPRTSKHSSKSHRNPPAPSFPAVFSKAAYYSLFSITDMHTHLNVAITQASPDTALNEWHLQKVRYISVNRRISDCLWQM